MSIANWAIGVDRDDYLKYAYLSGNGVNRDIAWEDNIQVADEDERKAQYKAECRYVAGRWWRRVFTMFCTLVHNSKG